MTTCSFRAPYVLMAREAPKSSPWPMYTECKRIQRTATERHRFEYLGKVRSPVISGTICK